MSMRCDKHLTNSATTSGQKHNRNTAALVAAARFGTPNLGPANDVAKKEFIKATRINELLTCMEALNRYTRSLSNSPHIDTIFFVVNSMASVRDRLEQCTSLIANNELYLSGIQQLRYSSTILKQAFKKFRADPKTTDTQKKMVEELFGQFKKQP